MVSLADAPSARAVSLPIRLVDCLAPFWAPIPLAPGEVVNWSKAPLAAIEAAGLGDAGWEERFLAQAALYFDAMAGLGYTAVVVDDLAHLVAHRWYPTELRGTQARWESLYRRLFALARARGLRIYVSSDYCFFNAAIDAYLRQTGATAEAFFAATVEAALCAWPEIDGVVLRIGESDGVDVAGSFVSRLSLHRPNEARRLLTRLLPLFEKRGKTLIVRTWTIGAFPIGDLLWNPRTWDAVFGDLESPALIVSLKYGDADFFRYLALNPLFVRGRQRKLIELQVRREYEGMGEYPSFVGWLYGRYLRELTAGGANLAGVFAITAGGWAPFRQLPYCGEGSIWNELNAAVVAGLAQGETADAGVQRFCAERGIADSDTFRELLRLAEAAIEEGLYIREFAESPRYFRRVRIPPLVWVFWHHVSTGGLVGLLHRALVRDPARAVAEGHRAVATVERMLALADQLGLDGAPFRFQRDTFRLLALQREVLLGVATPQTYERMTALMTDYRQRYPRGYRFGDDRALPAGHPAMVLLPLLVRSRMAYRRRDFVHLNRPASRLLAGLAARLSDSLPAFAGQQGMSPQTLLR
jgi:hypothetical protein